MSGGASDCRKSGNATDEHGGDSKSVFQPWSSVANNPSHTSCPTPPLLSEPVSDPLPLYRLRDGIVAVDLLAAAIAHLDFFTWLAEHPATFGAICAHFEIHPRPADVMMTLFNAMGLDAQIAGGVFSLHAARRASICARARRGISRRITSR